MFTFGKKDLITITYQIIIPDIIGYQNKVNNSGRKPNKIAILARIYTLIHYSHQEQTQENIIHPQFTQFTIHCIPPHHRSPHSFSTAEVSFRLSLAHCSPPLHQQYVVHGRPPDRQLQVALEHRGVDLQPHATSSRTALGVMSAQWYPGTGVSPSNFHPTQKGWLCIQEGPVCQQHATVEPADVHVWCALLHTLWLAEDFLSWEGPSSSWTVCISSRWWIPQPPHSTERKGKRIPASNHSCSFAVSSVNTIKWRFILFIKLIAHILPFPY